MSHWLFVILTIAGFESASAATLAAPQGGGLPTVSISTSAGPANELGEVTGGFEVSRAGGDISSGLTVQISIGGTATLGQDYRLQPAFVTAVSISANQTSRIITLEPLADNRLEGEEEAVITLVANAAAYTIDPTLDSASITILDDPVEVEVTDADTEASEAGPETGSFTISRTGGNIDSTITVQIALSGSASLGSDYTLAPAFVTAATIAGGETSRVVTLTPRADTLAEGPEEATVTLRPNNTIYNLGKTISGTVTIADDAPVIEISSNDPLASEVTLDPASFTVSRMGGDITTSITVGIAISGTAILNSDYSLNPPFVTALSISGEERLVTLTPQVPFGDVSDDEGEETVVIDLVPSSNYLLGPEDSVTLIIDDRDRWFVDRFEDTLRSQATVEQ